MKILESLQNIVLGTVLAVPLIAGGCAPEYEQRILRVEQNADFNAQMKRDLLGVLREYQRIDSLPKREKQRLVDKFNANPEKYNIYQNKNNCPWINPKNLRDIDKAYCVSSEVNIGSF
jgi:hypothetical protein